MARASIAVRYLAILSFAAFIVAAIFLGGDAINGHAENGHYFLSWHGTPTEVSSAVFNYSRYHAFATMGLFAAAVVSYFLSKPGASEAKWQRRLVLLLFVGTLAMSIYKYGP
jgi:hypothetical protein